MLYYKPGMTSIPEFDFGDRIGGSEPSIFGRWLSSGRTGEGKLGRCCWDELESMIGPGIYKEVLPVVADILTWENLKNRRQVPLNNGRTKYNLVNWDSGHLKKAEKE